VGSLVLPRHKNRAVEKYGVPYLGDRGDGWQQDQPEFGSEFTHVFLALDTSASHSTLLTHSILTYNHLSNLGPPPH
jgi:hypothetical protein